MKIIEIFGTSQDYG